MTLPFGLVALLASIFATAALLAYAYETLAVPLTTNILATPILYALLIVSWLGGTVFLILVRPWLRLRLRRFLLLALASGARLFVYKGSRWNWHPAFFNWRTFAWFGGLGSSGLAATG